MQFFFPRLPKRNPQSMGLRSFGKMHFFPVFWSKFGIFCTRYDVKIAENSKNGLKIFVSSET